MRTRQLQVFLPLTLASVLLSLIATVVESGPGAAPPLQPVPTPTSFFASQVLYTPLPQPDRLPQEVTGFVVDRTGAGVSGVQMRATASNFQAVTVTTEGGAFQFSLNAGTYAVQPTTLPSQPTSITVDGRRRIRVEFRERVFEAVTATPTATVTPPPAAEPPTAAPPTATPAPPATPTATRPPTATSTPLTLESPVTVPLFPTRTITPTPPRRTPTPPIPSTKTPAPQVNPTPWVYAFLAGIAFAVVLAAIWLLVTVLRR